MRPQIEYGASTEGSYATSQPYSSYVSAMAEVGVLGLLWVITVYGVALARVWQIARAVCAGAKPGDALPPLAMGAALALLTLVQMALLENWLEVARITFFTWALVAVVTKEFRHHNTAF